MTERTEREPYDFRDIEKRWSARWEADRAWAAPRVPSGRKRYVLEMFPYPSGDMHVGHAKNYAISDAISRYWRMKGYEVLHPFGYDAFGLPAENAAIQRGIHPREWTYGNIERYTQSCKRIAFTHDWDRTFKTCDPEYYHWNQWFFLRFYERDLAYRGLSKVNWCPSCRTVLANEQLSKGVCWRCGSVPEIRDLEQWFFKTTAYAQELLDDMAQVEWSEAVLAQQRNWIGRSEGAVVTFTIEETGDEVPVYTTRPDTLWGVTYFVFAPEHPIAHELAMRAGKLNEYLAFVDDTRRRTEIDRLALAGDRLAFNLEAHVVNPVNGESVPVFAADYVLMEYGTGAVMAVPAHDQRDFEFARQYDLPIRVVIQPADGTLLDAHSMTDSFPGDGIMVGSGEFTGSRSEEGRSRVIEWLDRSGLGRSEVQYRLRDWLISRQRYWGTPIPIVYCDRCGTVPLRDENLPVVLPDVVDYQPTGDATSPLASVPAWVNTTCPDCGGPARRETDTMDTFVDSSWYFLRFCDARNESAPFDPAVANAWMPVDQYVGGTEHAVMHLIYARFFTKVLRDLGLLNFDEPFLRLYNQGMVHMGGKVMSKSRGNIVDAGDVLDAYGADALRLYVLFSGPGNEDYDWPSDRGVDAVQASSRFLERVWRLVTENVDRIRGAGEPVGATELRRSVHRRLAAITKDYDEFGFNTAVAKIMELTNDLMASVRDGSAGDADLAEGIRMLLLALAPFTPYITEELWERAGGAGSVHAQAWPVADPELARQERVTLVVQVDSRVRDRVEVPADIAEDDALRTALASERVRAHMQGEPVRVIARLPRLINLLTR